MNVMFVGSNVIASSYDANASSNCFSLYSTLPFSFAATAFLAFSFRLNSSSLSPVNSSSGSSVSIRSGPGIFVSSLTGGGEVFVEADVDVIGSSSLEGSVRIPMPLELKITWKTSIILGSESIVVSWFGSFCNNCNFAMKSGSLMYPLVLGSRATFAIISGPKRLPIPGGMPPIRPPAPCFGPSFSLFTLSNPDLIPLSPGNFANPSSYALIESLYRFIACNAAPLRE
mmetsp:Transcript_17534/g.24730  ORF Transcript_17534/g.24730 Transcript_17534/m.24730 type:complete len:228 (+) Transcript_17534:945-1628(+)